MPLEPSVEFDISIKGELTGKSYEGSFVAKTKLSVIEKLAQDALYRQIVGANPQDASVEVKQLGNAISYLAKHLTKAPSWWTESDGGLKIEDMNVIDAVFSTCVLKTNEKYDILEKEAKAAQPLLKAELAKTL